MTLKAVRAPGRRARNVAWRVASLGPRQHRTSVCPTASKAAGRRGSIWPVAARAHARAVRPSLVAAGHGDESLDGDVGEHDRAAGLACQIEARPALPGTHVQQPPTRAEARGSQRARRPRPAWRIRSRRSHSRACAVRPHEQRGARRRRTSAEHARRRRHVWPSARPADILGTSSWRRASLLHFGSAPTSVRTMVVRAPLRGVDAILVRPDSSLPVGNHELRRLADERVLETGDRAAFQQLARDELAGLYSLARRLGGRDAEDLVQEALLGRAGRSRRSDRPPGRGADGCG